MEAQMTPIIPVKQVLVSFAGHEFLAVQLPDGRIAVVFRHFCEALHLNFWGQIQRIQANPTLARNFLLVRIKTSGGPQVVYALVISVLALWLGGFQLTRLSEEKRRLIIELQEHAEAAFSRPFTINERTEPPRQAKAAASEQRQASPPEQQPPQPRLLSPDGSSVSVFDALRAIAGQIGVVADHLEREHQEREAWQARADRQYRELERQVQALRAEVLARRDASTARPPTAEAVINDQQEEVLYVLLYCAERLGGQPQELLKRELLAAAGVEELSQLRAADWFEWVIWLVQRLG